MVLSGIRPSFPGLSQSAGQITHVLLTRSPLEYLRRGLSVRLACVKHAASVRPEPGSNSPQKEFQQNTEKAVKSPNLTKITNHHNPQKQAHAGVQKLLQRKNKLPPPTRRGTKKGDKKLNTITCQPIHQCSRNTKQYSKRCVFQHLTGTHQPTNHH